MEVNENEAPQPEGTNTAEPAPAVTPPQVRRAVASGRDAGRAAATRAAADATTDAAPARRADVLPARPADQRRAGPRTAARCRARRRAPVRISQGVTLELGRLSRWSWSSPKALYRSLLPGIMQVPADYIIAAARKSSLWPMTFGLACCAIEMIATYMAHHDLDRFGIVPWPSPRQCDVMIVAGTVTKKMAPAVKLLYQQMPNPKWVISMGACATNGGPYTRYDRVLQGVDKIIPVDVYVPGCPPRPEALMDGFIALQNKIMEERSRVG